MTGIGSNQPSNQQYLSGNAYYDEKIAAIKKKIEAQREISKGIKQAMKEFGDSVPSHSDGIVDLHAKLNSERDISMKTILSNTADIDEIYTKAKESRFKLQ